MHTRSVGFTVGMTTKFLLSTLASYHKEGVSVDLQPTGFSCCCETMQFINGWLFFSSFLKQRDEEK